MSGTITPPESRLYEGSGIEIRAVDVNKALTELTGYAVPYNEQADIGWYLESFTRGAFAKSIAESAKALPLLLFHEDRKFPIGAARTWKEEDRGLLGVWRLSADPVAQEAAKLARDGLLNFMSVRFAPIRSTWTYAQDFNPDLGPEFKDSVVRTEARLIETSLLSTPAYQGATVEFVRTGERAITREATGREIDGWRDWLEATRHAE